MLPLAAVELLCGEAYLDEVYNKDRGPTTSRKAAGLESATKLDPELGPPTGTLKGDNPKNTYYAAGSGRKQII